MSAAKKREQEEDALLDKKIEEQRIEKSYSLFAASGVVTAVLPLYLYLAVLNYDIADPVSLGLLAALPLGAAFCVFKAYDIMFETEYHKRVPPFSDAISAQLQPLRVQCAQTWSIFFVNALFLGLCLFFQLYIFRKLDLRINLVLSFAIAGSLVWGIAQKNEESRKRKKNKTR